jgi:hypothetical protein
MPSERAILPTIPGDAPALADIRVTYGGSNTPLWALYAWWQRAAIWNRCSNGDFEDDVDGWSVAAVAGVTGAATSITRNTTAARNKYGLANGQILTPATASTGATFKIRRSFYQGKSYCLLVWASSAAQTTFSRCRFGVSGDIANGNGFNLATTTQLDTAVWTPTVDASGAYLCFEVTAATATTMNIDGVCAFEVRPTSIPSIGGTGATAIVVTSVPEDWPAAPFDAIMRQNLGTTGSTEICRVEAIDYTAKTLTVTRALEGTTGITFSNAVIFPLPQIRSHYEGKGAQPAHGIIEAESDDATDRFTWALTANANARQGEYLYASGLGAAGSASANWLIDPHLLNQDDYTQGEVAVEVWARMMIHNGLTAPTAILSAAPESATTAAGVMTSLYGAVRYTEEYGSAGKPLVKPSASEQFRVVRLGTIRFPVDRANPLRWRLQLRVTWTAATAATIGCDYLILVPAAGRALSPSGKANDANYPKFIASSAETTKIIRADLSGLVAKPLAGPAQADHGLGGSLLELPSGNTDWLIKTSTLVPDDPTSDTTGELEGGGSGAQAKVHIAVTPRFTFGRGS